MAARKKTTTEVANYDEELAKYASSSATLTNSEGGGRFFSTQAGVLQYADAPLPGNQMCVIIGSWALENVYYDTDFDADVRSPPKCFAFCKDPDLKDEMGPPDVVDTEDVFERQDDSCSGCWANQFGSANKGKGKACSNRRRLACLPAGTYMPVGRGGGFDLELHNDPEHFKACEEAFLKVPVMSGKGFDSYVKDVAEQLRKPLFAVYTRVFLVPDAKSQFKVMFELIEPVEPSLVPTLIARHERLQAEIDFPYVAFTDDEEATPTKARASAKKKLTTKGGARTRK